MGMDRDTLRCYVPSYLRHVLHTFPSVIKSELCHFPGVQRYLPPSICPRTSSKECSLSVSTTDGAPLPSASFTMPASTPSMTGKDCMSCCYRALCLRHSSLGRYVES